LTFRWKEECHSLTQVSELKFIEMKKNFDNLKQNNEKLFNELQTFKIDKYKVKHKLRLINQRFKIEVFSIILRVNKCVRSLKIK
jgi:hypothetical protein